MSEASTVLSITKFVDNFINENGSENVINIWNEEARESFLKIFKKEIKKNGGASKKKSKNAPKGARSAYILFCNHARVIVNKESPELSNQEKMKLIAQKWNELKENDEEKLL